MMRRNERKRGPTCSPTCKLSIRSNRSGSSSPVMAPPRRAT